MGSSRSRASTSPRLQASRRRVMSPDEGSFRSMARHRGYQIFCDRLDPLRREGSGMGDRITIERGILRVPDQPIIPYVEGDGTGRDIWRASQRVFDAAVAKSYQGKRRIIWKEVLAGEKAF